MLECFGESLEQFGCTTQKRAVHARALGCCVLWWSLTLGGNSISSNEKIYLCYISKTGLRNSQEPMS